jgi:hypothetical protein
MTTQAPSKEKVPGPQDPRPAGCRCGDMPSPRCPVHLGKWPTRRSECTHTPQGALSLFNTMQRSGECLLCERDRLRGELEAAEQHVKILQEQRAAHEPPAKPVAWRGVLDSAYELHPRYVYSDSQPERGKWEPLYAAPAASAQPPPVGWVSVDDRLPELEAKVLYAFNGYTWLGRYKGLNDGLPCFAGPAGFISGDATHWMLCPEPPASPPTK